jgi:glycosyltransferase involved in cell wall biosynthesis
MGEYSVKFLYVTESDLSIDNGPGINEREFVNALLKDDRKEVICLVPYPGKPKIYFDRRLEYVTNQRAATGILFWASYCLYLVSSFLRILGLHRRHRFSAFVFRLGRTSIVPMLISRFLRVPLILKTLAKYPSSSEWLNWKGRALERVFFFLDRFTINKMMVADTVSAPHRDWLCLKFGIPREKLAIVPNGVNISLFSPGDQGISKRKLGLNHFEQIIGYVGALTAVRHIDLLIMSLKNIMSDRNVGLVIVGDGANQPRLKALARQEGLGDQVVFAGFVSYRDVVHHMRSFDVAVDLTIVSIKMGGKVLPSSYSQKVPQYLACGLPVVAWDVIDNEFLKEEGIGELVPYEDTVLLEKSIKKLLDLTPEERESLRSRARLYAENNFCIDKLARRRKEMWRRVVEKRHSCSSEENIVVDFSRS